MLTSAFLLWLHSSYHPFATDLVFLSPSHRFIPLDPSHGSLPGVICGGRCGFHPTFSCQSPAPPRTPWQCEPQLPLSGTEPCPSLLPLCNPSGPSCHCCCLQSGVGGTTSLHHLLTGRQSGLGSTDTGRHDLTQAPWVDEALNLPLKGLLCGRIATRQCR